MQYGPDIPNRSALPYDGLTQHDIAATDLDLDYPIDEEPTIVVRQGFPWKSLISAITIVTLMAMLPWAVENVRYSMLRGEQRAESEHAKLLLKETNLDSLTTHFKSVAKAVQPSVVHITTTKFVQTANSSSYNSGIGYSATGQGSGVIVDKEGYILTNYHVIEGAWNRNIRVKLSTGQTVKAKLVGHASHKIRGKEKIDLAVLKIEAKGLIAAEWGDSEEMEVGSFVWAFGSPFGLQQTVTFGIVSANHRKGIGGSNQEYLQTDAAVNPGNSGGPLVNIKGQLIGINTAIVGEKYQGVSLAIPSSIAKKIYKEICSGKHEQLVGKSWLGVYYEEVNEGIARKLRLDDTSGVLISGVIPDSPADTAGLRSGDVIVRYNGKKITTLNMLRREVAATKPNTRVIVSIIRNAQSANIQVMIGVR